MAKQVQIIVNALEHDSWDDLSERDRRLLRDAAQAASLAYAPYSNFRVGAAIRLKNDRIVQGNNQENASFPAGCCAERTALHAAMATQPDGIVRTIAIVSTTLPGKRPVSPCGICRQALSEQESRQGQPMRVLLGAPGGNVIELASAKALLPFSFDGSFLRQEEA